MNTSVDAVIEELLKEEFARGVSPNTYESLRYNLKRFGDWARTNVANLSEITPQLLLNYLLDYYIDRTFAVKKPMSWSLRKLGAFLAFHKYLPSNPGASLPSPKKNPREKLPEYLSEKEMRQLLTHLAKGEDPLKFTLVSLFLNTGLRPGDLEDIRITDYFPDKGYFVGLAKGSKLKRTPLSSSLILVLDEYLRTRNDDCEFLLVNSRGNSLKVATMRELVKQSARQAGLERELNPRMLRHTFATHFTDRHGSIMCKALLGHGSHRNTKVYAHLSPRRFRQSMNCHPFNREAHRYE